jgi:hypothetical protein
VGTTSLAQQAQAPDLSGKWKLNKDRSKSPTWFGVERGEILEIKQSGLKVHMQRLKHSLDENNYSYVIDGKLHESYLSPQAEYQAKTYWDGSTLVIEKQQRSRDGGRSLDIAWTSRYSLSSDGKILVVNNQHTRPNDGFKSEVIYDKQ